VSEIFEKGKRENVKSRWKKRKEGRTTILRSGREREGRLVRPSLAQGGKEGWKGKKRGGREREKIPNLHNWRKEEGRSFIREKK